MSPSSQVYPIARGSAPLTLALVIAWAFTQSPIALVAALRGTSITSTLLIGVVVLEERLDLAKVVSTMATVLGVALLRYARQ